MKMEKLIIIYAFKKAESKITDERYLANDSKILKYSPL